MGAPPQGETLAVALMDSRVAIVDPKVGIVLRTVDLGVHDGVFRGTSVAYAPMQMETLTASCRDGSVGIVDPKFGKQVNQQEAVASTGSEVPQIAAAIDERILHMDPPMRIEAQEASTFVAVQEADFIERLSPTSTIGTQPAGESLDGLIEQVGVVNFKRCPKELPTALSQGLPLQWCRQALEDAGHNWNLPNGDMVFVQPWQYRTVMNAQIPVSNSFSVICAESFEYLVEESIQNIGKGALAKNRSSLHLQYDASDDAEIAAEDVASMMLSSQKSGTVAEPQILRTFLHFAPTYCLPSESVTQSSTEAHEGGLNPRRICTACNSQ